MIRNPALNPVATPAASILLALALFAAPAMAGEKRHGLSAFGELRYPADFRHFDYVNPDAPKGGRIATIGVAAILTFNSFNGYILRGDAAQGLELLFDSLMTRAMDDPDAVYGLVAHSAELADDGKAVTFHLRPEARFSDDTPVTAEDIAYSFKLLKEKGHPAIAVQLRDVVAAEALDAHTVRYRFQGDNTRDLPLVVATLPIFSKAYYEAHSFDATSLEAPLGSGPYEIGPFKQGTFVSYLRRKDYWGRDLPVNRGRYNFDEIRYDYYRDRTAGLEAFKAGAYDLREEFTSKSWATEYDIPQVRDGRIKLDTLPDERPSGAQGFFLNTRRAKFADIRVRKALDYAFDFEWTNKNLFYGLYRRTESFFENSDLKAEGLPSEAELRLLEPFRDRLPEAVFGEPYSPPKSDGSGQDRRHLRTAARLLTEAGWTVQDGVRKNAEGERLTMEILMEEPQLERVFAPFVKNLRLLGIEATIRSIDSAQYQERMKRFDFDIDMARYALSLTPGPWIRSFWSSEAARIDGSNNRSGISDPAVDALIDTIIAAQSREELRTACRALDRVLRAGHYWVPQWHKASHHVAFWSKYSWPETKPKYARGILDTWWYDAEKVAKLEQAQ